MRFDILRSANVLFVCALQGIVSPDGSTVTLPANDRLLLGAVLQNAADGTVRREMYRAANAACAGNAEVSHLLWVLIFHYVVLRSSYMCFEQS